MWVLICTVHLTVYSYHFTYVFQSEFTLYSCLNVKKLLSRSRRKVWSLSDCNGTRTHNYLVRKRTLNHLAKFTKWLSLLVSIYLYGAFDCMLLSFHVRVSVWIYTHQFPEFQAAPGPKQIQYLKFNRKCFSLFIQYVYIFQKRIFWKNGILLKGVMICTFAFCYHLLHISIRVLFFLYFSLKPLVLSFCIFFFNFKQYDNNVLYMY